VFILDDGFQQRKLRRDLDLLVVDATQPLETNHIFPRGSLREPIQELRRCHAVIINGVNSEVTPLEKVIDESSDGEGIHCQHGSNQWSRIRNGLQQGCLPVSMSAYSRGCHRQPAQIQTRRGCRRPRHPGNAVFQIHFSPARRVAHLLGQGARLRAQCLLTTEADVKIFRDPGVPLLVASQSTRISERDAFQELIRRTVTA
jgi:hypothetical protein